MKPAARKGTWLPLLLPLFFSLATATVPAQTFTTLHSFTVTSNSSNSDGAYPYAKLLLSGNTLYGTAQNGGSSGNGVVFAVNTDGTGFTNLHSFTALNNSTTTMELIRQQN